MFPVLTLCGERGRAEIAQELNNLSVFLDMFLEVSGMAEFSIAVRTGESRLVSMSHQVIVKAVLSGEGGSTKGTFKWSKTSMTPVMCE